MIDKQASNICRTCLRLDGKFQSMFAVTESTDSSTPFAEIIMSLTSVEIALGDGMPEDICEMCVKQLSNFQVFKQKCEQSDMELRNNFGFVLDVKPDDYHQQISSSNPLNNSSGEVSDMVAVTKKVEKTPTKSRVCKQTKRKKRARQTICLKTPKAARSAPDLERHVCEAADNNISMEECRTCQKTFTKTSCLKIHQRRCVKRFVCETCEKTYSLADQLINHMRVHSGTKSHVCSVCSKAFRQISNLKDHMRTHNNEQPFLCPTCGKGFNQLGNLKQHMIRHSNVRPHLCGTCGRGFASKGELDTHSRTHTGARPFACPTCNHTSVTLSALQSHKRTHSGEKPFECTLCRLRFSSSSSLGRHMRTHTGEKPYTCQYCAKSFIQSNELTAHLRTHTGEKPFVCDVCGKAFRFRAALNTHNATHQAKKSRNEAATRIETIKSVCVKEES